MIPASGVRIGWADLPVDVRDAVEQILGAPVAKAVTQTGGFSPGSADRVITSDGRRAFVKAVGAAQNELTIHLHRREARVAAELPASVPAPALLGVYDNDHWVALVFEDVDGRHPATPWVMEDIDAVMTTLAEVAALHDISISLPLVADLLAHDLTGWHRLRSDPPADLDRWARSQLNELCALSEQALTVLRGGHLVHADLRADNLLLRPDGTVAIVDWPNAARGPAWLDRLLLLINVNLFGNHDVDRIAQQLDAEAHDVTAVLAGLTGYFLDAARRPPPAGLPTVRTFQAAQGERSLAWLRTRMIRQLEPLEP